MSFVFLAFSSSAIRFLLLYEREVRDRETRIRQNAGPAGQYRSDTLQMVYTPGAT